MDNGRYQRYTLSDDEVMEAARYAYEHNFASIVIQSGEQSSKSFTSAIGNLLRKIHAETGGKLHITLSLGEQTEETYKRWYEAGAHRYLLRIEVSNPSLYLKLHPGDNRHTHKARLEALSLLRKTGYQVGTGVMIGLPFQTTADIADDLDDDDDDLEPYWPGSSGGRGQFTHFEGDKQHAGPRSECKDPVCIAWVEQQQKGKAR